MFEQLKEMNAELEALKKTHMEKSKVIFTDVAKQLFDKHPVLTSFGWEQYTPYFNDGEECTFSARTDYPSINGLVSYDDELYYKLSHNGTPRDADKYDKVWDEAVKDVMEFLSNIDDSVFRDMFGDHKQITVTREGTKVEDYEHD